MNEIDIPSVIFSRESKHDLTIEVIMKAQLISLILGILLMSISGLSAEESVQGIEIRFIAISDAGEASATARYPGDKLAVRITGLEKGTRYLIRNVFANKGIPAYESTLETISNSSGAIATDTAHPLGGTYSMVDVDGIFWSMRQVSTRANLSSGYNISLEKEGKVLASAVLPMAFAKPGVKAIELAGTGLMGKLFLPARSNGPFPTIITFSGSEGGAMTGLVNATALANHGFAALGLAYFGAPGLPSDLKEIPLEYFEKAIQFLKSRPEIGDIAVMGPSRGGELSLLLGATFSEIKAVVAQVPSPIRWGGNVEPDNHGNFAAAWTFRGTSLPFALTVGDLEEMTLPDGRKAYSNRPAFEKGLADKVAVKAATTEIERTNGPILLIGGDDDQVWPSCVLSKMALKRLKKKERPFNDEMVCYPNAGHGVASMPLMPTTEPAIEHPIMHTLINMGGTPEGNASGQRHAWEKTIQFLRTNLRNNP